MDRYKEGRILSASIPVYWHGFRSSTDELQHYGWQFSVVRDPARSFHYHFIMSHSEMRLMGIFEEYKLDRNITQPGYHDQPEPLVVNRISPDFRVREISTTVKWTDAQAIDMMPVYTEAPIRSMSDMLPFNRMAPVQEITREVIIESKADMSVVEHLQMILDRQEETQAKLREKRMRAHREGQESMEIEPKQKQVRFQVVT